MADVNSLFENIVSISSFGRGQASKNFEKTKDGPVIVVKNNVPEAVIVAINEYVRLTKIEEEYLLLSKSVNRLNSSESHTALQND
jgi:PHD/YefM family antitoxin component YafN of YafNO toxin-antitoxin module